MKIYGTDLCPDCVEAKKEIGREKHSLRLRGYYGEHRQFKGLYENAGRRARLRRGEESGGRGRARLCPRRRRHPPGDRDLKNFRLPQKSNCIFVFFCYTVSNPNKYENVEQKQVASGALLRESVVGVNR